VAAAGIVALLAGQAQLGAQQSADRPSASAKAISAASSPAPKGLKQASG